MQTNRRSLGVVIIILGVIILALVVYFGFYYGKESDKILEPEVPQSNNVLPNTPQTNPTSTPGDRNRNYQSYDISKEPEHKINENDLIKMAESFAERLGSFSNYSNYSNFSDLQIMMTDNMKEWADKYVSDLRANLKGGEEYYGITTDAVVSKAVEYNNNSGKAKIIVTTQRRESVSGAIEGKVFNQDIEITMERINGDWLVDKAYWVK